MNSISSLLVLCCLILPIAACTQFASTGANSQAGVSGIPQPEPGTFTEGDSSAGSISPPTSAFTAFGSKPVAWRAIVDGPLLQIERSATELITLTAERYDYQGSINVIATDYSVKQQNRRRKNNVNLTINRTPCTNTRSTYDLSATLFYKNRRYTGCAVLGAPVTEQ